MSQLRLVQRRFARFMKAPVTIRGAMAVIVTAIGVSVLAGGVLIRLADPRSFPSLGAGMWWALQTVTTVGYGDAVPQTAFGRVVAGLFMVEAIAFVAIVTAVITSSFVERARRERVVRPAPTGGDAVERLAPRLESISDRLDRIERALAQLSSRHTRPD